MEELKRLNPEDIKELRKRTKKMLKDVPNGQRIDLGKELTELLLFDVRELTFKESCLLPENYKAKVKFLVWSGKFLRKLDLSKVSFDDVFWNVPYYREDDSDWEDKYPDFYEGVDEIDLSNTNARIDFYQSYEGKICRRFPIFEWTCCIVNCNFKNVDLSNNILERGFYTQLDNCNFANTGLKIDFDFLQREYWRYLNSDRENDTDASGFALGCDFRGLDFNKYRVSYDFIVTPALDDMPNNYNGTGIKISMSDDFYNTFDMSKEEVISKSDNFKKHYLTGCYINDKKNIVEDGLTHQEGYEYDKYKEELFNKVEETINTQKRRM